MCSPRGRCGRLILSSRVLGVLVGVCRGVGLAVVGRRGLEIGENV